MTYDTPVEMLRLLNQKRFACFRQRMTIPEEIADQDIFAYLRDLCGDQGSKEIQDLFLIPVHIDDVKEFMECLE